jgi:DNA (cytosine-5)-methyltransferase 1
MTMPRILDLFCGAGGASVGYSLAGFDVTGVDSDPRGNLSWRYPFKFHIGDWSEWVDRFDEFDVIHASPPCQAYSVTRHSHTNQHPELLEPVRDALVKWGGPYVIENVPGAPLITPLRLCGTEFNLTAVDWDGTKLFLKRHRLFESDMELRGRGGCMCKYYLELGMEVGGVYGGGTSDRRRARDVRRGGYTPAKAVRSELLGIDWMTVKQQSQAIPPAYTEHIGRQIHRYL